MFSYGWIAAVCTASGCIDCLLRIEDGLNYILLLRIISWENRCVIGCVIVIKCWR